MDSAKKAQESSNRGKEGERVRPQPIRSISSRASTTTNTAEDQQKRGSLSTRTVSQSSQKSSRPPFDLYSSSGTSHRAVASYGPTPPARPLSISRNSENRVTSLKTPPAPRRPKTTTTQPKPESAKTEDTSTGAKPTLPPASKKRLLRPQSSNDPVPAPNQALKSDSKGAASSSIVKPPKPRSMARAATVDGCLGAEGSKVPTCKQKTAPSACADSGSRSSKQQVRVSTAAAGGARGPENKSRSMAQAATVDGCLRAEGSKVPTCKQKTAPSACADSGSRSSRQQVRVSTAPAGGARGPENKSRNMAQREKSGVKGVTRPADKGVVRGEIHPVREIKPACKNSIQDGNLKVLKSDVKCETPKEVKQITKPPAHKCVSEQGGSAGVGAAKSVASNVGRAGESTAVEEKADATSGVVPRPVNTESRAFQVCPEDVSAYSRPSSQESLSSATSWQSNTRAPSSSSSSFGSAVSTISSCDFTSLRDQREDVSASLLNERPIEDEATEEVTSHQRLVSPLISTGTEPMSSSGRSLNQDLYNTPYQPCLEGDDVAVSTEGALREQECPTEDVVVTAEQEEEQDDVTVTRKQPTSEIDDVVSTGDKERSGRDDVSQPFRETDDIMITRDEPLGECSSELDDVIGTEDQPAPEREGEQKSEIEDVIVTRGADSSSDSESGSDSSGNEWVPIFIAPPHTCQNVFNVGCDWKPDFTPFNVLGGGLFNVGPPPGFQQQKTGVVIEEITDSQVELYLSDQERDNVQGQKANVHDVSTAECEVPNNAEHQDAAEFSMDYDNKKIEAVDSREGQTPLGRRSTADNKLKEISSEFSREEQVSAHVRRTCSVEERTEKNQELSSESSRGEELSAHVRRTRTEKNLFTNEKRECLFPPIPNTTEPEAAAFLEKCSSTLASIPDTTHLLAWKLHERLRALLKQLGTPSWSQLSLDSAKVRTLLDSITDTDEVEWEELCKSRSLLETCVRQVYQDVTSLLDENLRLREEAADEDDKLLLMTDTHAQCTRAMDEVQQVLDVLLQRLEESEEALSREKEWRKRAEKNQAALKDIQNELTQQKSHAKSLDAVFFNRNHELMKFIKDDKNLKRKFLYKEMELVMKVKELERSSQASQKVISNLETGRQTLRSKIESLKRHYEKISKETNLKILDLKNKVKRSEASNTENKKRIADLIEKLHKFEVEDKTAIKDLQERLEEKESELKEERKRGKKLEADLESQAAMLASMENVSIQLVEQTDPSLSYPPPRTDLTHESETLNTWTELQEARGQIKVLQEHVDKLADERDQLVAVAEEKFDGVGRLEEVTQLEEENRLLREELSKSTSHCDKEHEKIRRMQVLLDQLQESRETDITPLEVHRLKEKVFALESSLKESAEHQTLLDTMLAEHRREATRRDRIIHEQANALRARDHLVAILRKRPKFGSDQSSIMTPNGGSDDEGWDTKSSSYGGHMGVSEELQCERKVIRGERSVFTRLGDLDDRRLHTERDLSADV